jgi:hypothetical protein
MSDASAPSTTGGRRKGAWLAHVKKTMKAESGLKKTMGKKWFTHVLKSAKKSYHKKGGADSASDEETPAAVSASPATAGRRRRGKKTRRHRK